MLQYVTPETLTIIPTCPNTGPAFRGQNQDRRLKWSSRPKNNKTVPLTVPTEKPQDCPPDRPDYLRRDAQQIILVRL